MLQMGKAENNFKVEIKETSANNKFLKIKVRKEINKHYDYQLNKQKTNKQGNAIKLKPRSH